MYVLYNFDLIYQEIYIKYYLYNKKIGVDNFVVIILCGHQLEPVHMVSWNDWDNDVKMALRSNVIAGDPDIKID